MGSPSHPGQPHKEIIDKSNAWIWSLCFGILILLCAIIGFLWYRWKRSNEPKIPLLASTTIQAGPTEEIEEKPKAKSFMNIQLKAPSFFSKNRWKKKYAQRTTTVSTA